jgi:hypothetical protein
MGGVLMYAAYPVYYPSAMYARLHDEFGLWRESKKINRELCDFLGDKAADAHYDRTMPDFIKELTDTFGLERSIFVMSRVVIAADWDKRYDGDVRKRAEKVDFQDMKEARRQIEEGQPKHTVIDKSGDLGSNVHPCILNEIYRHLMKLEQEQVNLPPADISEENELDGEVGD